MVVSKANSTYAFLRRNISMCPRETKVLCYNTLLRPVMEYASIIWDPHTNVNIDKLEMVQRRYARFVFHDYRRTSSVTAMLNQLNWASLHERRARAKVDMVFRMVNGLVDLPATLLIPAPAMRGHSKKYLVPFARVGIYQHSFVPDSIRLWNALPQRLVDIPSLGCFRNSLESLKLR